MSEQSQLDRIETKLDKLIDSHSGTKLRVVKLETQAGFIKTTLLTLASFAISVVIWALNRWDGK